MIHEPNRQIVSLNSAATPDVHTIIIWASGATDPFCDDAEPIATPSNRHERRAKAKRERSGR